MSAPEQGRSYREQFQRLREAVEEGHSQEHLEEFAAELEQEVVEVLEADDYAYVYNRLNYAMNEYCCVGPAPRVIRAVGQALAAMGQRGLDKRNATTEG